MTESLLSFGEGIYRVGLAGVGLAYRTHLLKTHQLPVPVVSVGNLTWGGTGKTPTVMHLARGFERMGRHVAVLTRGYGGDEARLMAQQLHPIPVVVGADRVASGRRAVREHQADLLLLDDGYQQWRLKKDVEILMVDAEAPFGNGHLIPRGILREPVSAAGRANLIIIKRTNLDPEKDKEAEAAVRRVNPNAPLFFARYRPVSLTRWPSETKVALKSLDETRVATMAGIARPEQFEKMVIGLGADVALKYRVRDHHPYSVGELTQWLTGCQRQGIHRVITTPKDAVRIPKPLVETLGTDLKKMELLVLDVELELEPDEGELLHRINSLLAGPRTE